MDQKFHERLPHQLSSFGFRSQHVQHTIKWEQYGHFYRDEQLLRAGLPSETRNSLIPNRSKQLLDIWMGHELKQKLAVFEPEVSKFHLFLLISYGQFQPRQLHVVAFLVRRTIRIVIQNHRQLLRAPGLLQQVHGELLALPPQLQILRFALLNE